METQLRQVNAHFARLNGMSGAHMLDLYGRTTANRAPPAAAAPSLQRKASKRLPLREATRALLRQAHSKLPQGVAAGLLQPRSPERGSLDGSQPGSAPASATTSRTPSLSFANGGGPGVLGVTLPRQATVRFDVPAGEAAGVPRTASASGVLQVPDEREERLLPYRWAGG